MPQSDVSLFSAGGPPPTFYFRLAADLILLPVGRGRHFAPVSPLTTIYFRLASADIFLPVFYSRLAADGFFKPAGRSRQTISGSRHSAAGIYIRHLSSSSLHPSLCICQSESARIDPAAGMQAVPFIRIQPTANRSAANRSAVVRRHSSDYWTLFCIRQTTILHLQPRRLVRPSPPSSSPAALPFPCRQSERSWTRRHVFRGGMYPAVGGSPWRPVFHDGSPA